jgi:hypothetical protein
MCDCRCSVALIAHWRTFSRHMVCVGEVSVTHLQSREQHLLMSVQLNIWFPSFNSFFKMSHGLSDCCQVCSIIFFALVIISAATIVDCGGKHCLKASLIPSSAFSSITRCPYKFKSLSLQSQPIRLVFRSIWDLILGLMSSWRELSKSEQIAHLTSVSCSKAKAPEKFSMFDLG